MAETKTKLKCFSTTVTTEVDVGVDIDPEDLHDAGWHHESECGRPEPAPECDDLGTAVASLHRQAHPSQGRSVVTCREEPCRSLTLAQLRLVPDA